MSVCHSTLDELRMQLVQHSLDFLTHSLSQGVGLASGEPCQLARQKHHLLLVYGHSVGVVEVFLHLWKVVFYGLRTLFSGHELRNIVHRPRTVEGIHRNQVLKSGRLEFLQPFLHTRRLELEYARGVSASVKFVGRLVVNRDFLYVYVDSVAFFDAFEALLDDGQCPQSEEVHLEHTHFLNEVSVVLAHPHILSCGLVLGHTDGNIVREVPSSDNHCTGVHSRLSDAAFEFQGILQDLFGEFATVFQLVFQLRNVFVAVLQGNFLLFFRLDPLVASFHEYGFPLVLRIRNTLLLGHEFFALSRLFAFLQEYVFLFSDCERLVRNHLRETVALVYGNVADASHVLDCRFGCHRAESDDVGNMVLAVCLFDIFESVVAPVIVEVYVYIRHIDTVRIEETLKQKVVTYRVQIGDFEAVSHC